MLSLLLQSNKTSEFLLMINKFCMCEKVFRTKKKKAIAYQIALSLMLMLSFMPEGFLKALWACNKLFPAYATLY